MLTSYAMKCPYPHCDWFGSLLPQTNRETWRNSSPRPASIVEFRCPQCQGEWRARIVGDDAVPLPLEEVSAR